MLNRIFRKRNVAVWTTFTAAYVYLTVLEMRARKKAAYYARTTLVNFEESDSNH